MNKQELIEKYKELEEGLYDIGARVACQMILQDLEQLDETKPLKLKDIIKRINELEPPAKQFWLNEILKELGSDYGSMKYRSGYEQGKLEGAWVGNQLKDADKLRQELNKPVVKQFVADWYEENKDDFEGNLFGCVYELFKKRNDNELSEFENWVIDDNTKPFKTLVNMHQFGYEVEKEKRYRISMPKARNYKNHAQILCEKDDKIFWCGEWYPFRTKFTRKELEEADFGWVFDCPGIEIEEVE